MSDPIAGTPVTIEPVTVGPATEVGVVVTGGQVAIPVGQPALLEAHIADSTPHPAYDDLPSLTLVFENGLI